MGRYYYAVSSLPDLYYDSETYPTDEQFLALCAENLSRADLRAVLHAGERNRNLRGSALMDRWLDWNLSLRADLASLRALQRGKNADEYQKIERVAGTEELARDAFNAESPLAAEEMLERGRWKVLEDLEVRHYFDLEKLLVYRLKIFILERKALFDFDAGRENFTKIYESVTEHKNGVQPE